MYIEYRDVHKRIYMHICTVRTLQYIWTIYVHIWYPISYTCIYCYAGSLMTYILHVYHTFYICSHKMTFVCNVWAANLFNVHQDVQGRPSICRTNIEHTGWPHVDHSPWPAFCSCHWHKWPSGRVDTSSSVAHGTGWQRTTCTDSELARPRARSPRDPDERNRAVRLDVVRGTILSSTQVSQLKLLRFQEGDRWCAAVSSDGIASTSTC